MSMRNKTNKNVLLAAVLLCGTAFASHAQVTIFSDNLDARPLGGGPGYAYGDSVNASYGYVAGVGVGGSQALVVKTDISGANGYSGTFGQFQIYGVSGNTSANLSDYTLSFDAEVNMAGGGIDMTLQTIPATGPADGESDPSSPFYPASANVFQHFAINLSSMMANAGFGLGAGAVPTDPNWQLAFGIEEGHGWANPSTGDQVIIDNIQLTMVEPVPEPASSSFCVMGGVAALAFLRRRKS